MTSLCDNESGDYSYVIVIIIFAMLKPYRGRLGDPRSLVSSVNVYSAVTVQTLCHVYRNTLHFLSALILVWSWEVRHIVVVTKTEQGGC